MWRWSEEKETQISSLPPDGQTAGADDSDQVGNCAVDDIHRPRLLPEIFHLPCLLGGVQIEQADSVAKYSNTPLRVLLGHVTVRLTR